jgi:hypothetical protein
MVPPTNAPEISKSPVVTPLIVSVHLDLPKP